MSTMGTMVPRRLTTPLMKSGALAIRVGGSEPRISCTFRMSMPYSSCSRRKVRYSRAPAGAASAVLAITVMGLLLGNHGVSSRMKRACAGAPGWAGDGISMPRPAPQAPRVQNQGHRTVAENGGARHIRNLAVVRLQILHDHLVLAEQFIDE